MPSSNPTTALGWKNLLSGTGIEGDGNWSLRVGSKIFWVTGDTLQGNHNTLRIIENGAVTSIVPAIPNQPDGSYYWLGPMVVETGTVYAFGSHLAENGTGIGTDLLAFTSSGQFLGTIKTPSSNTAGQNVISWGAGLLSGFQGTYVYGTMNRTGEFGFRLFLAFAGKLSDYSTWKYWNGSTFVTSPDQAMALDIQPNVTIDGAIQLFRKANTYTFVSKQDGKWGNKVVIAKGLFPWGPFTTTKVCDSANDEYLAGTHAEIVLASGKSLVTINKDMTPVSLQEFSL